MGLDAALSEQSPSRTINTTTRRTGRKAVLIAHASDMALTLRAAEAHRDSISDVVVFDARHQPSRDGLRVHFMSSGWPTLLGVVELPRRLRNIGIELLDTAVAN
jgi:pimeloyl-ACP methyl ester carboxylesterase